MKKVTAAALVVLGLILTGWFVGCHSFSTFKDSTDSASGVRQVSIDSNRLSGLVYYLPKGRIRITGDFKSAGGGGDASQKSPSPGGAQRAAKASEPNAGEAPEQKNFVVTIAAELEADPSQRYYLKPVRNYFYDDDIHLKVNEKNLLSTGNATAEDQTARIISTTASMAAQVAGIPTPGKGAMMVAEGQLTINGLRTLIQDAINKKKASVNTTLPGPALLNLREALGDFPDKRRAEGNAFLQSLVDQDAVTLGSIMKLIGFYLPEASTKQIEKNKAPEFFDQLFLALRATYVEARPFSVVFDPVRAEPDDLRDYGFIVTVKEEPQPGIKLLKEIWEGRKRDVAHGIVFRALKPYRVTIQSVPGTWFYIRESRLIFLPDTFPDHTLVLDYSRLAFVKKTTNVAFVDGIPQDLAQTAPSSVLGFLAIPKGIIQAIVPLSPGITGPPGGVQGPGVSGTTGAPSPAPSPNPGGS